MSIARLSHTRWTATTDIGDRAGLAVRRDGLATRLILNRPASINALHHDLVTVLRATLDDLVDDPTVETVVLAGAGTRGLCAGGDLLFLHRDMRVGGQGALAFWRDLYDLVELVATYPKPIVALMDGLVFGGGLGLSARAQVRIVTERSRLAMPETRIGFFPDTGGLHLLSHLPGEVGTCLGMCAHGIGAADALTVGLADRFVPSRHLVAFTDRLAVAPWQEAVAEFAQRPEEPGELDAGSTPWLAECFAGNDPAAIHRRLLEHPDPAARRAGTELGIRSPWAAAVTLHGLRTAASMSLPEELALELRLDEWFCRSHDFAEGIRAQVVDKDRRPRWSHAALDEIDPAEVARLFA